MSAISTSGLILPIICNSDEWLEALDEKTGRKFYANVKTGEAVWEMPASVKCVNHILWLQSLITVILG